MLFFFRIADANADNDVNCRQLLSDTHEFSLVNACDGHSLIQSCPPLFISVAENSTASASNTFRCTDAECRFPDNIRFSIAVENLGCFSGVGKMMATVALVVMAVLMVTVGV